MNKLKKDTKSLESQIIKDDLKKFGRSILKVGKGTLKAVTYPLFGIPFAMPTMIRKGVDYENNGGNGELAIVLSSMGFIFENLAGYWALANTNKKLIPYIALTQIGTNLASGLYEWRKKVKREAKRMEEMGSLYKPLERCKLFWAE